MLLTYREFIEEENINEGVLSSLSRAHKAWKWHVRSERGQGNTLMAPGIRHALMGISAYHSSQVAHHVAHAVHHFASGDHVTGATHLASAAGYLGMTVPLVVGHVKDTVNIYNHLKRIGG